METNWKEGFYPTCKNCGAEMNKIPVYIDEIIEINRLVPPEKSPSKNTYYYRRKPNSDEIGFYIVWICSVIVLFLTVGGSLWSWIRQLKGNVPASETETNLEIYGDVIYLDEVSANIYRICTQQDEYEKKITWDYGAKSYYDYDSDCYLWYNTDVSPNLWQYWYEDIAGSNYYGWMECEGADWYIEVSETEWEPYQGDTSKLWHIENSFDDLD